MRCTLLIAAFSLVATSACTEQPTFPASAFSLPVDFSYACEGPSATQAPENDERAADFAATRMCPDVALAGGGSAQGALIGLVLNQAPAGVQLLQMNPVAGNVEILDADRFIPGFSAIPVGSAPIRILRADDWASFYVLSAGAREVTRLVLTSAASLTAEKTVFALPGTPSDGLIFGDWLVVASADRPEIWRFKLSPLDTTPQVTVMPDIVHRMQSVGDGRVVVTWKARPVVSVMSADGAIIDEKGLVAACADGLDNDGDGWVDKADAGCFGSEDPDEAPEALEVVASTEPPAHFTGGDICTDGIDNDGDGWTDGADPSCAAGGVGERVAACADGVDNDGDGLVDLDDPSCYSESGLHESVLGPYGPFFATSVRSKAAGDFVYVFDQKLAQFHVFSLGAVEMTRVSVNADETLVPDLTYRAYGTDTTTTLGAVRGAAYPALAYQGIDALVLFSGLSLNGVRGTALRGEVWSRFIAPAPGAARAQVDEGLSSASWFLPAGCDPADSGVCVQPEGDDDTHVVMGPRLDGSLQTVQVVYRGAPRHRLAQKTDDPSLRSWTLSRPELRVHGETVLLGNALPEGSPFLGPVTVETVQEALDTIQPRLDRQYGVWPPDDPEMAPSESWSITYEGELPGSPSVLGRLVTADMFYAPGQRFCELGVEPGDWLTVRVSPERLAPALHYPVDVETLEGVACPTFPLEVAVVEVPVLTVGMETLVVDPAAARLVPQLPVIDSSQLSSSEQAACEDAVAAIGETLGLAIGDHPVKSTPGFEMGNLPDRVSYSVRADEAWTVVGGLTGYVHPWYWDGAACVQDNALSPLLTGRMKTATAVGGVYATCPPLQESLSVDAHQDVIDPANRFANYSFQVDMMPACRNTVNGVEMIATRRDTTWTFAVDGPDDPAIITYSGIGLSPRVGLFGFRRQLIHLDTSGNRVSVLTVTPGLNTGSFSPTFE